MAMNLPDKSSKQSNRLSIQIENDREVGEWLFALDRLTSHWREVQWQIADLLREGIDRLSTRHEIGQLYRLASETMGVSIKTLQNLVSISRRFPPELRVDALSPSFHMVVAGIEPESAREMLNRAAEEGWSRHKLSAIVLGRREIIDPKTGNIILEPISVPGISMSGNEEDIDYEEPKKVTFVVRMDATGIESLADSFCRHANQTDVLLLAQLLITNINREIGKTVIALVDVQSNRILNF
jgi:hypothetical protein